MKNLFLKASAIAFAAILATNCTKTQVTPAPEEPSLELTVSDIGATTFTVNVKSSDPSTLYYVGITTRESYDNLGDPMAVAEGFVQIANESGTVDWTHADGQLIHQGDLTIDAGELWTIKPKRDYAILAFGVGEGGSRTCTISKYHTIANAY